MNNRLLNSKTIENVIWVCWFIACMTRNNYIIMSVCIIGFLVNAAYIKNSGNKLKSIVKLVIFLVIILGNIYFLRSAAIIVYPILALIVPTLFYIMNSKFIWLSIPVTVIMELIMYRLEYSYYEARPLFLILTLVQIIFMVIVILLLKKVVSKINN